jgi:hypothetical protein
MTSQKLSTKKRLTILLVWWLLLMRVLLIGESTLAMYQNPYTVLTTVVVITVCGNNVKESGEDCDGADLNGATCISRGYIGGTLTCRPSCEFNTTNCESTVLGSPGGGGGAPTPQPPATTAIFKGMAYPGSDVTLLKDGQVVASSKAGADAKFSISITGLSAGNYIFSLYSEDYQGNRSSLLTFPVSITAGVITTASGIFISPTIAVDQEEIAKGGTLVIFGQTTPVSDVVISVNSPIEQFFKTKTNTMGAYLHNLDTSFLDLGEHLTKSKASTGEEISPYSRIVAFTVMAKGTVIKKKEPAAKVCARGDYNCDTRINLVDFSIAAYWYKRAKPPAKIDLNNDGKVDLVDFSILAYNWTG